MKKLSVFLAMLLMLCLVLPFSAMADGEEKMFWVTHFNDGRSEGTGAIFTETDTAGGWWIHVAFAPVEGVENTYEIVEMTNGLGDGKAATVAVPEGGFVWASNYGNDYSASGGTNYTSPNCSGAINEANSTWKKGQQYTFTGLDLENQTIPTTTPEVNWYDDAYVCTATYSLYKDVEAPVTSTPVVDDNDDNDNNDNSSKPESSSAESSVAESTADSSTESGAEEDGDNTVLWIIIGVVGVVVIAGVVVVVLKKK